MLGMFSFLPPVGFYAFAGTAVAGTWWLHNLVVQAGEPADTRIFVVGGILAFLFAFLGYQKSLEEREEKNRPRVSSDEVMQKLAPAETGRKDRSLDVPPPSAHGPADDTPLGRLRARSRPESETLEF